MNFASSLSKKVRRRTLRLVHRVQGKKVWKVPDHLERNFRVDEKRQADFQKTLSGFMTEWNVDINSEQGKNEYYEHLLGRLIADRQRVIPWLDAARPLMGANILEIGCGTGASTLALAEQGAHVTAVDIDDRSMLVAQARCKTYEVDVNFHVANATQIETLFDQTHFDFIIYFAVLEHMTVSERIDSLKSAWNMLLPGGLLCVVDTPNRLWSQDFHTSLLPFFHWLPDELAAQYAQFSPRDVFNQIFRKEDRDMLNFQRWGRGVSYHEFDLALKPSTELKVVSCLNLFLRERLEAEKKYWDDHPEWNKYFEAIKLFGPKIHDGFYQMSLDLIIQKDL